MIYVLLSKLYNKTIGALSTLLISVTPAHMMFSVVAMSDMMGLFFILAVIYLLYLGLFSEKYLYTSAFLFGITIGIRLTDIVIIVLFIAVLIYLKDIKNILVSFVMFALGIFLWLIPSVLDAGGLRSYIEIQRAYNVASDKTYIILHGDIIGILREMDKLLIMGWTDVIHVFILISITIPSPPKYKK
jgi:Gpi18-like mannosyltransferase